MRVLARLADCLAPPAGEPFARRAVIDLLVRRAAAGGGEAGETALWLDEARQAGVVAGPDQWTARLAARRRGLERRLEALEARGAEAVDDEDEVASKAQGVALRLAAVRGLIDASRALTDACAAAPQRAPWGEWAGFFAGVAAAVFDAQTAAEARDAASRLQALAVLQEDVELGEAAAVLRELLASDRVPAGANRPRWRRGRHAARGARPELPHGRVHGARRGRVPVARQARPAARRRRAAPRRGGSRRAAPARGAARRGVAAAVRASRARRRASASCCSRRAPAPPTAARACPHACCCGWRPGPPAVRSVSTSSSAGEPLDGPSGAALAGSPAFADDVVWVDERERDVALLLALASAGRHGAAREYAESVLGGPRRRSPPRLLARVAQPGPGRLGRPARRRRPRRARRRAIPFDAEMHPTRLERFISCPFSFLLRDLYELRAPEEPGDSLEMDPLEFGTLAHDILQRAYEEVMAGDLGRDEAQAAVVAAWRECCREAESRGVTGAALSWEVRRELLLEDLLETVRLDPVFSSPDSRPVGRGVAVRRGRGPARGAHPRRRQGRCGSPGRLDRVDETPSGARVIDYKSGGGGTERKRVKERLSVQLPVYRLAVRQATARSDVTPTIVLPLPARHAPRRVRGPRPASRTRRRRRGGSRELVAGAVELVDAGLFPRTTRQRCDYCDVRYACGVSAWTRARKREHESLAPVVCLPVGRLRRRAAMTERAVCDADVRHRVTTDLGTTFLLEAGAGTGKTTRARRPLRELRARPRSRHRRRAHRRRHHLHGEGRRRAAPARARAVRAAGRRAAADAGARGRHPRRARRAGRRADQHHPRLRRPPAAGVPRGGRASTPRSSSSTSSAPTSSARGCGSEWLTELAAGDAAADAARRGLVAAAPRRRASGRGCARSPSGPGGSSASATTSTRSPPELDEPDLRAAAQRPRGGARPPRRVLRHGVQQHRRQGLQGRHGPRRRRPRLLERRARRAPTSSPPRSSLCRRRSRRPRPGGAKGNWSDAHGGKDELQVRYKDASPGSPRARDAYAEFLTSLAVAVADAFSRWAAAAQLAQGRLDFTDLLGLPPRPAGERPRGARGAPGEVRATSWSTSSRTPTRCRPRSCSTCASAGRSRATGARSSCSPASCSSSAIPSSPSIASAAPTSPCTTRSSGSSPDSRTAPGPSRSSRQNFRTTPAVVDWVNNVFSAVFDDDEEEGRQPGYQWVEPYRPAGGGPARGRAARATTSARPPARPTRRGGTRRGRWPRSCSRCTGWTTTAGRCKTARPAAGEPRSRGRRAGATSPSSFRATTGLETYEQALREAGVPYRVDGGKAYFARREVDDVLLCLRAVDDPSDGPAVYGALHSTLFGFSDDELFLFWAAGGRFDLFAGAAGRARRRRPRRSRALREPARAPRVQRAARAGRRAGAPHQRRGGPGGDGVRRPSGDRQPREAGRAGTRVLAAPAAWASARSSRGPPRPATPPASRSPRSTTTATWSTCSPSTRPKGLEYPIVVLAGGALGGWRREAASPSSTARSGGWRSGSRRSYRGRGARPRAGPLHPAEGAREAMECQRGPAPAVRGGDARSRPSRRHLLRPPAGTRTASASAVLLGPIADALPAPAALADEYEDGGLLVLPPQVPPRVDDGDGAPDDRDLAEARGVWSASREKVLEHARLAAPATSPSGLEHVDEQVRAGGPGAPPGRARALALGSAVHQTLELCDLDDAGSLASAWPRRRPRELERPDIAAEAAELAAACWRAEPVRAAARAAAADPDAVHREVPLGALLDGVVLSGAVDLLYRDGEDWVVVDYKTDRAAEPDVLLARYRPQGAAYALAAEAVLGEGRVREVCFVAARAVQPDGSAHVVRVPVDDELRAEARREIAAAAAAGGALRQDELGADDARRRQSPDGRLRVSCVQGGTTADGGTRTANSGGSHAHPRQQDHARCSGSTAGRRRRRGTTCSIFPDASVGAVSRQPDGARWSSSSRSSATALVVSHLPATASRRSTAVPSTASRRRSRS